ncbi:TrmH family RNA methyltransferase [Ulvibacter antarcticus]|uniref:SpoU rRNA methylase family protein n=1 Tax=Ulvibacter antarcticus TaxID=442714 RepID=A0A3L9Z1K7_9FLAO|nr:TrmH family RNA methyltransferase [Ulvibacter antarcticus]RMA64228.1 SpoU rRNA methylase family protein [Ulvibacter antarcticus]
MSIQLSHKQTTFQKKKSEIIVVCDGLESPSNVGALFRICDAMGVKEIIFCNTAVNFNSRRLHKTSRNTHQNFLYSKSDSIGATIESLQQREYYLIGLEITANSKPLRTYHLGHDKVALFIGNEGDGISEAVLQQLSQNIHIEMFGENSSMNVIQATAIALFALTKL